MLVPEVVEVVLALVLVSVLEELVDEEEVGVVPVLGAAVVDAAEPAAGDCGAAV